MSVKELVISLEDVKTVEIQCQNPKCSMRFVFKPDEEREPGRNLCPMCGGTQNSGIADALAIWKSFYSQAKSKNILLRVQQA